MGLNFKNVIEFENKNNEKREEEMRGGEKDILIQIKEHL